MFSPTTRPESYSRGDKTAFDLFLPGHGVGGKVETASRRKKARHYLYFRTKIMKPLRGRLDNR